jgi:hypothetical protein
MGLAIFYEPDRSDPIDVQLSQYLGNLDPLTGANLAIRRIQPGEYLVDGRRVKLQWSGDEKLVVCEGNIDRDGVHEVETHLTAYLHQAAGVAAMLGGHSASAPAVTRVPGPRRLTFVDAPLPQMSDDLGNERVRSMKVACEQARLREHAAAMYEQTSFSNHKAWTRNKPPVPTNVVGSNNSGSIPASMSLQTNRSTTPPPSSNTLLPGRMVTQPMVAGFRNETGLMIAPRQLATVRIK